MFKRFIDYLRAKDINSSREKIDSNQKENKNFKDSFFFTGIDYVKVVHSKPLDNSNRSSSVQNSNKYNKTKNQNLNNKEIFISLRQKQDFLQKNKNKVMNIFSKYQNPPTTSSMCVASIASTPNLWRSPRRSTISTAGAR